jgi:hypothetical protein
LAIEIAQMLADMRPAQVQDRVKSIKAAHLISGVPPLSSLFSRDAVIRCGIGYCVCRIIRDFELRAGKSISLFDRGTFLSGN